MPEGLDRESLACRAVLTPAEAADVLRISRATLYRLVAAGAIPVVAGLGGSVRIPARRLLEMIEGETSSPRTQRINRR